MQQTPGAWLVLAGRYGEREALALDQGLTLVGWRELEDLSGIKTRENLVKLLEATYPEAGGGRQPPAAPVSSGLAPRLYRFSRIVPGTEP